MAPSITTPALDQQLSRQRHDRRLALTTAVFEAFLERYRAAAEKEKTDPLGLYAPPLAYAQMQVMEQAVARIGKIDQQAIGAISTRARSRPCLAISNSTARASGSRNAIFMSSIKA